MLKTFSLTDIGRKRTMNQDYVFTSESPVGNLKNLFIVADGMGGYNGGGLASSLAANVMKDTIADSNEVSVYRIFEEAVNKANATVHNEALKDSELEGMGTTIVAATITGDCLQVCNIGDSRLYIIDDDIRQITVDHSFVEEMIRVGGLDRESARNHPKKNIITRAVGAEESVTADYFTVKMTPGQLVLMCSDGLTNMVEDEDILRIVKSQRDLVSMTEELIKAANSNGGRDNIAVVLVDPFSVN